MSKTKFIEYLTDAGYSLHEAMEFWSKLDYDDVDMVRRVIESIQNA